VHPVTLATFVNAWGNFLLAIRGSMDDQLVANIQNEVRVIESSTGETVSVGTIAGSSVTMTGGGDALPQQIQALIRMYTNVFIGGRRLRGRIFIPGQLEANNLTTGGVNGAEVVAYDAAMDTMRAAMGTSLVIYSPTNRAFAPVTAHSTWSKWAGLRSRRD
jgi:hypothetical protein